VATVRMIHATADLRVGEVLLVTLKVVLDGGLTAQDMALVLLP